MRTLFGFSLDKALFIIGGIFLLLAAITLLIGYLKSRSDRNNPKKTLKEIQASQNASVIAASVLFAFAVVMIGTGLYFFLKGCKPSYVPPPPPSPAATSDEKMIDKKIQEGWFLQADDSTHKDPAKDPCVINKDNLSEWGLKSGKGSTEDCSDSWVLRKNTKTYRYNPEKSSVAKYRGMRVLLNENIPGLGDKKATDSPAFFA